MNGMAIIKENSTPIGIFLSAICLPGILANIYTLYLAVLLKLIRKNLPHFFTTLLAIANLCNLFSRFLVLISLLTGWQVVLCGPLTFINTFFVLSTSIISFGVALERALAILAPFWYERLMFPGIRVYLITACTSVVLSGLALTFAVIVALEREQIQEESTVSRLVSTSFTTSAYAMIRDDSHAGEYSSFQRNVSSALVSESVSAAHFQFFNLSDSFSTSVPTTLSSLMTEADESTIMSTVVLSNVTGVELGNTSSLLVNAQASAQFDRSLICGVPPGFTQGKSRSPRDALDTFFGVFNVIVLVVVLSLNWRVMKELRRMDETVAASSGQGYTVGRRIRHSNTFSLTRQLLVLSAVYVVCWTPMTVTYFLSLRWDIPQAMTLIAVVILSAKSTCDPFVNLTMTASHRQRLLKALRCGGGRGTGITEPTPGTGNSSSDKLTMTIHATQASSTNPHTMFTTNL